MGIGKLVAGHFYFHVTAATDLPEGIERHFNAAVAILGNRHPTWNVARVQIDGMTVSFLEYPDFEDLAFPVLRHSVRIDLQERSARERSYADVRNPPILHRKELLLPPEHPRWREYMDLTEACEEVGLFDEVTTIGTRRGWEDALTNAGLRVEGHRLIKISEVCDREIKRHRTAIRRPYLSTPMQALLRHGFLDGQRAIFDYGCGRGDDVRYLKAMGISACGWDPHYAPGEVQKSAEIVNLGFVVNVIDCEAERYAVVRHAFSLANQLLVVSAMLEGRQGNEARGYSDGVITKSSTFQKYYTQESLRTFLENALKETPVAVGPGLFFVFKDKNTEQHFLYHRFFRKPREQRVNALSSEQLSLLQTVWETWLRLGRKPDPSEIYDIERVIAAFGTLNRALARLKRQYGEEALLTASKDRKEDLLVHFALERFQRRKLYASLPLELKRDVSALFGSYSRAREEGKQLLMSIAHTQEILTACREAASSGLGWLDGEHSLSFHGSLLERLPPILRVYVACGSHVHGDLEEADIIRIHIHSGKITLLSCTEFNDTPLPRVRERVKINLRQQRVDFFAWESTRRGPYLLLKSRYLPVEYPRYKEQVQFDKKLQSLVKLDFTGHGPSPEEFDQALHEMGLQVRGYKLSKICKAQ